jgi:hypothetical protein
VVLAPGRPVQRVTLRVAITPYDGLRPVAVFDVLGNKLRVVVLALGEDVDGPTRGQLSGVLAKTAKGLELLELRLEGNSDEVRARLFVCLIAALTRGSGFRSRCKRFINEWAVLYSTAAQRTRTPHALFTGCID